MSSRPSPQDSHLFTDVVFFMSVSVVASAHVPSCTCVHAWTHACKHSHTELLRLTLLSIVLFLDSFGKSVSTTWKGDQGFNSYAICREDCTVQEQDWVCLFSFFLIDFML